jgi:peroxisomal 3,2-trans-enoyl-CoA isomerase
MQHPAPGLRCRSTVGPSIFPPRAKALNVFWLALGVTLEVNSSVTFVNKLGLGKASELLYWGKKMSVEELLEAGFVKLVSFLRFSELMLLHPPRSRRKAYLSCFYPNGLSRAQYGLQSKIFSPSADASSSPTTAAAHLHSQVLSYLRDNLGTIDLDAMLLTKRLIKAGQHEQNNPDAVSLRESSATVERAVTGIPQLRFQELARKTRRHKL